MHNALRLLGAGLLMVIFLLGSMGVIVSADGRSAQAPEVPAQSEEVQHVWVRMAFAVDPTIDHITLCLADGTPVQELTPDVQGRAVSDLLTPDNYIASTAAGQACFTLNEIASVACHSPYGWSDGEMLHLTDEPVGTLRVRRRVDEQTLGQNDGFLDYTLTRADGFYRRAVLRADGTGEESFLLQGIPYGTFVLRENGTEVARVTVGAETPNAEVELPSN